MPNWCEYDMCAVSKNRESLERLIKIMNYEDSEYYIYRVNQATAGDIEFEDDLYTVRIMGFVAWSCGSWFDRIERLDETIDSGGHYVTLDILCERLGIAVEVFGGESGMEFQEHYLCNPKGDTVWNECTEWHQTWFDDDGNDLPEPIESGGFDYYCDFDTASAIYNAV
jgi:hypothetical protein